MAKATLTQDDRALLEALGVETETKARPARTAEEERIIAGFEEIQRFIAENGRLPSPAEDAGIFERIYAVRLAQIRRQPECRAIAAELDHHGLLAEEAAPGAPEIGALSDDALLAALDPPAPSDDDIANLRHVRPYAERKAAEDVAFRTVCKDFKTFKPLFEAVRRDIASGTRETQRIRKDAGFLKIDIKQGRFFVLGGQTAYIAEVGETFSGPDGRTDARMRVIYDNGTENDLLLRSMQRALYKDEASRLISDPGAGPLFSGVAEAGDRASGTIYVLRSMSDHPEIRDKRDTLHKIGVTRGDVEKRIANARHDPTFLLADVEVVATYALFNIDRTRLEKIVHTFFSPARAEIPITDRFGKPVTPREWFFAPLFAIEEAVDRIRDGTILEYRYDPTTARLVKAKKRLKGA